MINRIIKYQNIIKKIFESNYFLIFISLLSIINSCFNLGIYTYIELLVFLILMLLSNSRFFCLPSLISFAVIGGMHEKPNFKSFGFIFCCILGFIFLVNFIKKIFDKRKEIAKITVSNSFIITYLLLVVIMLLSLITTVSVGTTLLAILSFLENLLVMYVILIIDDDKKLTKEKISQSFVALFYTIFVLVFIRFVELLQTNSFKDVIFNKYAFILPWCHINHYCSILCICCIFSIYLILSKFRNSSIFENIIYYISAIFSLLICIFLAARGPLIGLACALGVMILVSIIKYRKNYKISITLSIILLVCIISSILLYFFVLKDLFDNKGLNGRADLWNIAIKHFKENLFLGTGYGTQRIFILKESTELVYNYHNYFLQISTCGIVGIVGFIIYLVNILFHCIDELNWYRVCFIGVFTLFLVNGFVDTLFFSSQIMPYFSIALCFLELKPKEIEIENKMINKFGII